MMLTFQRFVKNIIFDVLFFVEVVFIIHILLGQLQTPMNYVYRVSLYSNIFSSVLFPRYMHLSAGLKKIC